MPNFIKTILVIISLVIFGGAVSAATVPQAVLRDTTGFIQPLSSADFFQASYLKATSTGVNSSFRGTVTIGKTATSSSSSILEILGNTILTGGLTASGGVTAAGGTFGTNPNLAYVSYGVVDDSIGLTDGTNVIAAKDASDSKYYYGTYSGLGGVVINGYDGNVGIGTSSPYSKLSVVGTTTAQNFRATSTTATSTFSGGLNFTKLRGCDLLSVASSSDTGGDLRCAPDQLWDDFERTDTSPGTVSDGPGGTTYVIDGYGSSTTKISNGRVVSDINNSPNGAFYLTTQLKESPDRYGARISWVEGNGGPQAVAATLIVANARIDTASHMFHLGIYRNLVALDLTLSGVPGFTRVLTASVPDRPRDGTPSNIEVTFLGNNTARIQYDEYTWEVTDPILDQARDGNYMIYEQFASTNTVQEQIRYESIWAGNITARNLEKFFPTSMISSIASSSLRFAANTLQLGNTRTPSKFIRNYDRTISTTTNEAVGIAEFNSQGGTGLYKIDMVNYASGFSTVDSYLVPVRYNATANTWQRVLPVNSTGLYVTEDIDLDVNVNNSTTTFRVRRVAGTAVGKLALTIESLNGLGSSAAPAVYIATSTITAATVPTTNYSYTPLTQYGGLVGIATSSPRGNLEVQMTAAGTPGMVMTGVASQTANYLTIYATSTQPSLGLFRLAPTSQNSGAPGLTLKLGRAYTNNTTDIYTDVDPLNSSSFASFFVPAVTNGRVFFGDSTKTVYSMDYTYVNNWLNSPPVFTMRSTAYTDPTVTSSMISSASGASNLELISGTGSTMGFITGNSRPATAPRSMRFKSWAANSDTNTKYSAQYVFDTGTTSTAASEFHHTDWKVNGTNIATLNQTGDLNANLFVSTTTATSTINYLNVAHLLGSSTIPTIATSTGAGQFGVASLQTYSSDMTGLINVTTNTGDTPSTSATIATLTFSMPYPRIPFCTVLGANAEAASFSNGTAAVYATSTQSAMLLKSNITALDASSAKAYQFIYRCN